MALTQLIAKGPGQPARGGEKQGAGSAILPPGCSSQIAPVASLDGKTSESTIRSMKGKTSITLSLDLLTAVDEAAAGTSRSAFIERVLRTYLRRRARAARNAQELQRLNRGATRLNREAADVLGYQAPWPDA